MWCSWLRPSTIDTYVVELRFAGQRLPIDIRVRGECEERGTYADRLSPVSDCRPCPPGVLCVEDDNTTDAMIPSPVLEQLEIMPNYWRMGPNTSENFRKLAETSKNSRRLAKISRKFREHFTKIRDYKLWGTIFSEKQLLVWIEDYIPSYERTSEQTKVHRCI